MTWAGKRQFIYVIILLIVISVFGWLIIYPYFKQAPSCKDLKQNGDELGVDCGGSCALACNFQVDEVSVIWARSFKVVAGRYNAVAYLENHNKNTGTSKISYRFRFADKDNLYIGKREGSTFIPPGGRFAIFEPAVDVGNSIPVYTTFEFTQMPNWVMVPEEKISQLKVSVFNIALSNEEASPVLSATLRNDSFFTIPEMNIITILYDANHNAVSASRTYLEDFRGEETKDIAFTWPEPFSGKVVDEEIIPIYDIFLVKLR